MITIPTVLVLGAGASHAYGLPLGSELTHDVCKQLLVDDSPQANVLTDAGFPKELIRDFVNDLRHSGFSSVDAFLETRPEYVQVGKAAIAAILIPLEDSDSLFPPKARHGNWYQFLASHLSIDSDDFCTNDLSVITFNYDRSFEHYVRTVIRTRRRCSNRDASIILERVPVIHVHGSLGSLQEDSDNYRDYSPELTADTLNIAASRMIIVSEATDNTPEFEAARTYIARAERIYFLGFGYAKQNVRRLFDLRKIENKNLRGFGTASGMGPFQIKQVQELFDERFRFWGYEILPLFTHEAPLSA